MKKFIIFFILFLFFWVDLDMVFYKLSAKNSRSQHYGEEMTAVLQWLKDNSFPQDVVLCEWTEGNLVIATANRGVVATSKVYPSEAREVARRYQDLKKFFFAENENDAMEIVNKYSVRWIYLRKKPDLASLANKSNITNTQRFVLNNELTPEGRQRTIIGKMLSKAEFSNFKLVLDSPDFLIYRVRPFNDFSLTDDEKKSLLKLARETIERRLKGENMNLLDEYKEQMIRDKFNREIYVDVALYVDGKLRGSQIVPASSIPQAVSKAALNAIVDPRFSPLRKEEIDKTTIEIYVMGERFPVANLDLSAKRPPEYFGRQGFFLLDKNSGKRGYFLPSVFNKLYFNSVKSFLSSLCLKSGLGDECFKDKNIILFVYDGQYFAENSSGGVINFEGTVPVFDDTYFKNISWENKLYMAARWLSKRQLPYGGFLTVQYAISGDDSEKEDLLRDGFSVFALWEVFRVTGEQEIFNAAELGLEFLNDGGILRKKEDIFKVLEEQKMPTGNLTFLIMANISAYQQTKIEEYLRAAKTAADYLVSKVNEEGEFLSTYGTDDDNSEGSDIVSGQAIVALSRLALITRDERYQSTALKAGDFVISQFRSQRRLNQKDDLSLASKAWLTNAFYELYQSTHDKKYAEFGIEVADWLLSYQRQSGPKSIVGSFPNTPSDEYTYIAGTGKIGEAMVDAYRLAEELGIQTEKYKNALDLTLRWLSLFQYEKDTVYFFKPNIQPQILGGLRQDFRTPTLRTDYAGHYIISTIGFLDIMKNSQ